MINYHQRKCSVNVLAYSAPANDPLQNIRPENVNELCVYSCSDEDDCCQKAANYIHV